MSLSYKDFGKAPKDLIYRDFPISGFLFKVQNKAPGTEVKTEVSKQGPVVTGNIEHKVLLHNEHNIELTLAADSKTDEFSASLGFAPTPMPALKFKLNLANTAAKVEGDTPDTSVGFDVDYNNKELSDTSANVYVKVPLQSDGKVAVSSSLAFGPSFFPVSTFIGGGFDASFGENGLTFGKFSVGVHNEGVSTSTSLTLNGEVSEDNTDYTLVARGFYDLGKGHRLGAEAKANLETMQPSLNVGFEKEQGNYSVKSSVDLNTGVFNLAFKQQVNSNISFNTGASIDSSTWGFDKVTASYGFGIEAKF